jgi:hypothetical protein
MATIDEFVLKNIGLWWRYGISRHYDEWKYIIIGRIFESEIILIPPSLKNSKSSSNGSYRNTDEVWWKYGISRSCDEWWFNVYLLTSYMTRFGLWIFMSKSTHDFWLCRSLGKINRFWHTFLGKTGWSSTSDRNVMSFREWRAAKREKRHKHFYHEWKITRAFPTTHVSTYFVRKQTNFTIANS